MQKTEALRILALAFMLAVTAASVLLVLRTGGVSPDIANVLLVIAGMAAFAAVNGFQKVFEAPDRRPAVRVWVDENVIRRALAPPADAAGEFVRRPGWLREAPWEVDASQLLAIDPSLALAKIRIDIERELRRLAFEAKALDVTHRPWSAGQLVSELVRQQVLPVEAEAVLRDILPALNSAVHGGTVDKESAVRAVRAGGEIIAFLERLTDERRLTSD
jgi:hypothetical protein